MDVVTLDIDNVLYPLLEEGIEIHITKYNANLKFDDIIEYEVSK